jgi:hypothetical protein
VNFSSTTFNSSAYFRSSKFNGTASFRDSKFNSHADFVDSNFNGLADFYYSNFNGDAHFESSKFNSHADFVDSKFNGDADFRSSNFNRDAHFESSNFNGTSSFGLSKFNGNVFIYSKFNGTAIFDGSVFNKGANLNDVKFENITKFDDVQFAGDAFFEKASFNKVLSLTRTRYDKLYIRWYNITGGLSYDDTTYMSLMKNFRDLGYFEDYDLCYYQYRVEHRGQPWPGIGSFEVAIRKFSDVFLQYFYGYGKKPLYPLGWSIGTILFFGAIWWIGGLREHRDRSGLGIFEKYGSDTMIVPKRLPQTRNKRSGLHILAEAIIFSTTVFLSGTRLFIDPPELPEMPRWTRFLTKVVFTAERVLGAFFSILFFLAIGATVVR